METIRYNGRNVYTPSETTKIDLENSQIRTEYIEDAYFSTTDKDRMVNKVDFNRQKIDADQSGLIARVNGRTGSSSVSIVGLDRIVGFMVDSECLGRDLSTLKGKPVITYSRGVYLLGISIPAEETSELPSIPSDTQYHPVTHRRTSARVH
ncbi:MAG: hypothetical protein Q7K45_02270 [Nanoarchaeota archaeon]|nr:hypothetical protein [Nanoarchaeota archaeon]